MKQDTPLYAAPKDQWVSVKDRLPEDWEAKFVYGNNHHGIAYFQISDGGKDGKKARNWYAECEIVNVTHWMELPEPPKEPKK